MSSQCSGVCKNFPKDFCGGSLEDFSEDIFRQFSEDFSEDFLGQFLGWFREIFWRNFWNFGFLTIGKIDQISTENFAFYLMQIESFDRWFTQFHDYLFTFACFSANVFENRWGNCKVRSSYGPLVHFCQKWNCRKHMQADHNLNRLLVNAKRAYKLMHAILKSIKTKWIKINTVWGGCVKFTLDKNNSKVRIILAHA